MYQQETQATTPLFDFSVDPEAQSHLLESSKWARFLGITGFIAMGLLLIGGLAMLAYYNGPNNTGMVVAYLIAAAIYFYPVFALYRFAVLMKSAINMRDQRRFNDALSNLKGLLKYTGIFTIILLCIYIPLAIWGMLFLIPTSA